MTLTWENIEQLVKELSRKILLDFQPEIIVAIAEGGWVPAILLKKYIKCPYYSIRCKNYDDKNRQLKEVELQDLNGIAIEGKSVLIIDEVADSGTTLESVYKYILTLGPSELRTAVLHKKQKSIFSPNYISETTGNEWIHYPWE